MIMLCSLLLHLSLKETTHKNFELNNGAVLELEDVKHQEKLTWQAFSQLLFRLSSADFQINSDSARYYVGALKKKILIFCAFQLQSEAVK